MAVRLLALLVAAAAVGLPNSPADDLNHRTAASAGPTTSLELKHSSPDLTSSGRLLTDSDNAISDNAMRKWPVVVITGTQLAW
eukprot:scaffold70434_cov73-Phaeocystis_antarctica.AAC.1